MKVHQHIFERIASPENLFAAWDEFRRGKGGRRDVREFAWHLEEQIFALHRDLTDGRYRHGPYDAFTICDPKQRLIHKAGVADRVVHHAIFAALNPLFEPAFIAHSFSCRTGKGTHKAVSALECMLRKESRNHTRPCFALKCDVHRFFASVDHDILLSLLRRRIGDPRAIALLQEIVGSFGSGKGLPIGNLTSQLFANVYLHELDQFVKHTLRAKHYVRYTDDFIFVSSDEVYLRSLIPLLRKFLCARLYLALHPRKIIFRKARQGVDFLGYILLPHHRVLRTRTKRRMFRKLQERTEHYHAGYGDKEQIEHSLQSYLGVCSHANTFGLRQKLQNQYWYWM